MDVQLSPITLRFRDIDTETLYRDQLLTDNRGMVRNTYLIAAAIIFVFVFADHAMLGDAAWPLTWIRLLILIPICLAAAWFSTRKNYPPRHEQTVTLVAVPVLITLQLSGLINDAALIYQVPGTLQVVAGVYFILAMRFTVSAPLCLLGTISHLLAALVLADDPDTAFQNTASILTGTVVLMTIASYRMERASRLDFCRQRELDALRETRAQDNARRIAWLENLAAVIRHEIRAKLAGLRTSLELIGTRQQAEQQAIYLERGQQCVKDITHILDTISDANSLEAALLDDERVPLDLINWLSAQTEGYRAVHGSRRFELKLPTQPLPIESSPERLSQLLDKLVDNALSFSEDDTPIGLALTHNGKTATLSVSNQGPALPGDRGALFEQFSSTRLDHAGGNLGLGLYVARLLTEWHGGRISASHDANGKRTVFSIELPVHAPLTS